MVWRCSIFVFFFFLFLFNSIEFRTAHLNHTDTPAHSLATLNYLVTWLHWQTCSIWVLACYFLVPPIMYTWNVTYTRFTKGPQMRPTMKKESIHQKKKKMKQESRKVFFPKSISKICNYTKKSVMYNADGSIFPTQYVSSRTHRKTWAICWGLVRNAKAIAKLSRTLLTQ